MRDSGRGDRAFTAAAWSGDVAGAAAVVAEADSVAAATGSRIAPYATLRLLALLGGGGGAE